MVSRVGAGMFSWGDRAFWGFGQKGFSKADTRAAYNACIDAGITFLDTAEVYGFGDSERFLGEYIEDKPGAVIATKFAPLPWRFTADEVVQACQASLQRLGL